MERAPEPGVGQVQWVRVRSSWSEVGLRKGAGVGPTQEGRCGSSCFLALSWLGQRLATGLGSMASSTAKI